MKKDAFSELEDTMKDWRDGFFILFDIIDSTIRKKEYKHIWTQQTKAMSNAIYKFYTGLHTTIMKQVKIEKIKAFKMLGDGFMMFFVMNSKKGKDFPTETHKQIASIILKEIITFLESIEEKGHLLYNIQLKTVITFLTDIYIIKTQENMYDILGRGIDFSFRLEQFGGASHYVINKMFFECLDKEYEKYGLIYQHIERYVKGWDNPEKFFILTGEHLIKKCEENIFKTNFKEVGVVTELFKSYRDIKENKKEDNKPKLNLEEV